MKTGGKDEREGPGKLQRQLQALSVIVTVLGKSKNCYCKRLSLYLIILCTGLSKINGAKLRESFCPAAASHSRPRQAGAEQNSSFFLHNSVHRDNVQSELWGQNVLFVFLMLFYNQSSA